MDKMKKNISLQNAPEYYPVPLRSLKTNEVISVLPGIVSRVLTTVGEQVMEGQLLIIVEAMKMENEILAPRAGTVCEVCVSAMQHINIGDVLVRFTEE